MGGGEVGGAGGATGGGAGRSGWLVFRAWMRDLSDVIP